MALQSFRPKNFGADALARIEQCNSIIALYQAQGMRLTLRQLYYQLVTRNLIPNVEKSYKNLSTLVSDGRLAGKIDWDAIEDRGRQPRAASEFKNLGELAEAALRSYRLPRWENQNYYVELWVEKDALAGVLWPLAHQHHVTLMVNKGYSSQSAMYESACRFMRKEVHNGRVRDLVLLYLGDHDPSGEDMVRDIRDRLHMFGVDVDVRKVALTIDQVDEYNPPPNPAKITDPRASAYIRLHGDSSWEVDALPPEVLSRLIREAFEEFVDQDAMAGILAMEEADKKKLRKAVAKLMEAT